MNNYKETRWRQRFDNFDKAFNQLNEAIARIEELDDLSKEGMVQRFEYTYELAWKTLKDYLKSKGEVEKFQRDIIKKAFQLGVLSNGDIWMDVHEKRNLMAHTYNEKTFNEVIRLITEEYFKEIKGLHSFFKSEHEK